MLVLVVVVLLLLVVVGLMVVVMVVVVVLVRILVWEAVVGKKKKGQEQQRQRQLSKLAPGIACMYKKCTYCLACCSPAAEGFFLALLCKGQARGPSVHYHASPNLKKKNVVFSRTKFYGSGAGSGLGSGRG